MKNHIFKTETELRDFLDEKVDRFNRPEFIEHDPVSIPHLFSRKEDIEIMGFWAAILAWGQRTTILSKSRELVDLMDGAPFQFITQHRETDLKRFGRFKHRTFNETDTLYFIQFFSHIYSEYGSLEWAFTLGIPEIDLTVETALNQFRNRFTSLEFFPSRTGKHVSSPAQKSACKRLNMFLRWMVRTDDRGVDFGIWKSLKPAQLICPCDLHVERVGRLLGLIERTKTDWQMAMELTENLGKLDPEDPVKYDFALFGLGIEKYFGPF